MRIVGIDLWRVRVPLPAPFHPSWIPGFIQTENRFTLIRMRTQSGLEGWSAGPAIGREHAGLGDILGPYILGERADDLASIAQRVREMGYLGWRCSWIEPAVWDIVGKARGKPVYELLGGPSPESGPVSIRLYASTGEVRSGDARAQEVDMRIREGFEAVKLRVHAPTLEEDLAQIRRTRELIGDRAVLGVDANQGWRVAAVADAPCWDYDRALAFCNEAAALGFGWVEEPLAMDAYDDLARLRAATPVTVTGAELNNQGLPEFKVMLEKGCFDVYQPDATFTGGIGGTFAIMREVARHGAAYTPHTWTNGIGFAINLQLHGASPWRDDKPLEYPLDPPGWVPGARDGLLTEPWTHDRGRLTLPTRPGLGFEIDRWALFRHGSHFYKGTRLRTAIRTIWDKGLGTTKKLGATRDARLRERRAALDAAVAAGKDPARDPLGPLPLQKAVGGSPLPKAEIPVDEALKPG